MSAHVGDIGTIIRYTTTTDVSGASTLTLKYLKPDGSGSTIAGEWIASVYSTMSAQFTTTAVTDLDQEGTWLLQVSSPGRRSWERPPWMQVYTRSLRS